MDVVEKEAVATVGLNGGALGLNRPPSAVTSALSQLPEKSKSPRNHWPEPAAPNFPPTMVTSLLPTTPSRSASAPRVILIRMDDEPTVCPEKIVYEPSGIAEFSA